MLAGVQVVTVNLTTRSNLPHGKKTFLGNKEGNNEVIVIIKYSRQSDGIISSYNNTFLLIR